MDLLKKLTTLEHEAAEFGFKWETADQIMAQIRAELIEIEAHLEDGNRTKLQEEIGDLIHAAFSLCVFCQFDANETLAKSITKFENRFKAVKTIAAEKGYDNLQGQSFQKLMEFWDQAKKNLHKPNQL